MALIKPQARLINLASNTTVATSLNLLDWEVGYALDAPGTLLVTVGLGDAGDATAGGVSFAKALLDAAGGAASNGTIQPTLLELSLDGLSAVDNRKIVENPLRTPSLSGTAMMSVSEAGDDIATLYNMVGIDRATYTDVYLADILGKAQYGQLGGGITPIHAQSWGLTKTGQNPYLSGLLLNVAGSPAWSTAARARLKLTAVVDPLVAFSATNVDIWADYLLKALDTIVKRLGGVHNPGDAVIQGARGHMVLDMSDAALNLASSIGGVVCNGAPTPSSIGTLSNAARNVARSVVIGNVGGSPVPAGVGDGNFRFRADQGGPVIDERTEARIQTEYTTIQPDLSLLYGQASFIGGASNANFPAGGRITGLTTLNGSGAAGSGSLDDWTVCLPVVAVNVNDTSGGLFYYLGDSEFKAFPNWPAKPVTAMWVDGNASGTNGYGQFYAATPSGVYTRSADPTNTTDPWTLLGGLTCHIDRLQGVYDTTNAFVLYALAKGNAKGINGVYRFPGYASSVSGAGYDGWTPEFLNDNILDMVATDYRSFFVLVGATQDRVFYYSAANPASPLQVFALPPGPGGKKLTATRLSRVITAGNPHATPAIPATQSIWALTSGDSVGVYVLKPSGGGWAATFVPGNVPGTSQTVTFPDSSTQQLPADLVGPTGKNLQVYSVVGLGLSLNGIATQMFACTNNGLYYCDDGDLDANGVPQGAHWKSANGQNGLDGTPVSNVSGGQQQRLAGTPTNRLIAVNDQQFFNSNSSAIWWTDITRGKLNLGPLFTLMAQEATRTSAGTAQTPSVGFGPIPANKIVTIGPMTTPPLVGQDPTTHLVYPNGSTGAWPAWCHTASDQRDTTGSAFNYPHALPDNWYWQRVLDERMDWSYRLVNASVPIPNLMYAQLTDLETNEDVPLRTATQQLGLVHVRWLGENSQAQTTLQVRSTFTQDNAGLRLLRPTHQVLVTLQGSITQVSSQGQVLSTTYVDYADKPFYVLAHSFRKSQDGDVTLAEATTTLGTMLRTGTMSPDDIVTSLQDSIKSIKTFGSR